MSELKIEKQELIQVIPQSDKKEIHITDVSSRGKQYIDVRQYYFDKVEETFKPGKGIWIPQEVAEEVATVILDFLDIYHIDPSEDSDSQLDEQEDF